jgi:hypothetical protein
MMQMLMLVLLTVLDCIKGSGSLMYTMILTVSRRTYNATKLAEETGGGILVISEGVLNAWRARKIERNCSS